MYGKKHLKVHVQDSSDIYIYDGSLPGFYTCVYDAVHRKSRPVDIVSEDNYQPTLYTEITVETDDEKAMKVRKSVMQKISKRSLELIETVFIGCYPGKEMLIFDYLIKGYEKGAEIHNMLTESCVADLLKAEGRIMYDAHMYKGFIRFSDYDGVLIAMISSPYFILPFLVNHFTNRLNSENFMIFDETYQSALIFHDGEFDILSVDTIELPQPSEDELKYRKLWKEFYDTIAIKERINPKLRMNMQRKRFWKHMLEMQDQ